jgi:hypothetical protein
MGNEVIAEYDINGRTVEVLACWDKGTPDTEVDFYDVYVDGECANEGDPYYDEPTVSEIEDLLETL